MDNSSNLKGNGVTARMVRHPVSALLGAVSCGALSAFLGSVHGAEAAAIMFVLGSVVGAPLGAMLAASTQGNP